MTRRLPQTTPVVFTEYLVDGCVGGQGAVEDGELALEPLRDVVPSPARVNHRRNQLHVHDMRKLSGFLQVVEALLLHQLPYDFVGYLGRESSLSTQSHMPLRKKRHYAPNLQLLPAKFLLEPRQKSTCMWV